MIMTYSFYERNAGHFSFFNTYFMWPRDIRVLAGAPFFSEGTSLLLKTAWLATNRRHYAKNEE